MKTTKKLINALKRHTAKRLFWSIVVFIIATIPVMLFPEDDHTGSLMIWIVSGMMIYDSIHLLLILNCKNPKEMKIVKVDDEIYLEYNNTHRKEIII